MLLESPPTLRVYTPDAEPPTALELAARELLRPPATRVGERDLEPFSRGWFEEIELKRYRRAGEWLPRVLEFSRHRDESLVMLGPGLGSDALQYLRHETHVTLAITPHDNADAIRRNFEFRGLDPRMVPIASPLKLPFTRGQFDLAYLNALDMPGLDVPAAIDELHRILKPGGKLFALVPAWYDVDRWQKWLLPHRQLYHTSQPYLTGPKLSARELRRSCRQFENIVLLHRQLRRSELPHLWRAVPLSWMERLAGRVLAVRASKPVLATRSEALIAAA